MSFSSLELPNISDGWFLYAIMKLITSQRGINLLQILSEHLDPRGTKWLETEEDCIKRSFITCTIQQILVFHFNFLPPVLISIFHSYLSSLYFILGFFLVPISLYIFSLHIFSCFPFLKSSHFPAC